MTELLRHTIGHPSGKNKEQRCIHCNAYLASKETVPTPEPYSIVYELEMPMADPPMSELRSSLKGWGNVSPVLREREGTLMVGYILWAALLVVCALLTEAVRECIVSIAFWAARVYLGMMERRQLRRVGGRAEPWPMISSDYSSSSSAYPSATPAPRAGRTSGTHRAR